MLQKAVFGPYVRIQFCFFCALHSVNKGNHDTCFQCNHIKGNALQRLTLINLSKKIIIFLISLSHVPNILMLRHVKESEVLHCIV